MNIFKQQKNIFEISDGRKWRSCFAHVVVVVDHIVPVVVAVDDDVVPVVWSKLQLWISPRL